ncbi:unnamed protein product [Euphydryas editha]|uniref:Uncharacterized protein n=1 Tax=Euphydryas editha TaxID=104508 RepID=A0AAU9TIA2_EUPED|nr:unnamed protein product [Euphydryas editha]
MDVAASDTSVSPVRSERMRGASARAPVPVATCVGSHATRVLTLPAIDTAGQHPRRACLLCSALKLWRTSLCLARTTMHRCIALLTDLPQPSFYPSYSPFLSSSVAVVTSFFFKSIYDKTLIRLA